MRKSIADNHVLQITLVYSYILIHKNIEEPQLTNKRKVNGERRENPILVLNIILQSFTTYRQMTKHQTNNKLQMDIYKQ